MGRTAPMNPTGLTIVAGRVVLATMIVVACSGGGTDKAGGHGAETPRVLRLADVANFSPEQIVDWAEQVRERSNGSVEIDIQPAGHLDDSDFELETLDDLENGRFDMAWVGARAFDRAGVKSFQPLLAPLLIDSHDLQAAVFEQGIPQEMLGDLAAIDLVGVGILPGPMRKMVGVDRPFVQRDDFVGAVIGTTESDLAERSLRALGAIPRPLPLGTIDDVDGDEQHLTSIVGNHFATRARYLTANVNLWPRPLVIVMSRQAYDALSPDQRDALREASDAAVAKALATSRDEDQNGVASVCRDGMSLPAASDAQLADLRKAVQPVYDFVADASQQSRDRLAAIEATKADLGAPPDTSVCETGDQPEIEPSTAAELSGTYTWTLTDKDVQQHGTPGDKNAPDDWYPTTFTMSLDDGRWKLSQTADAGVDGGTYEQFRDRLVLHWDSGAPTLTFTYSAETDGDVVVTPVEPMAAGDAFVMSTEPWSRASG